MTQAHRLDCEAAATTCRFISQSANEVEAVEAAKQQLCDIHGEDSTADERRCDHPRIET